MWCLFFACFFVCYSAISEAKLPLPSYISACHKDDPNINKCALKSAKLAIPHLLNGDKKYGIPKLSPLELETLAVETGGNLTINFHDVKVIGLETIGIQNIRVDLPAKTLYIDISLDKLNILGKYQMDGKILIIPLKGNGNCNLSSTNVGIKFNLHYGLIEKNGDTYIKLRRNDIDLILDNFHFHFDNLFNGNEELGRSTNKILNEEWMALYTELKPAITETISTIAVTIITKFTEKVPYNMILL